jgi:hypothetical protein
MVDLVADHHGVDMLGASGTQGPARPRRPGADRGALGVGEVGEPRRVPARLYHEVPEVDRLAVVAGGGRVDVGHDDEVVRADRRQRGMAVFVAYVAGHVRNLRAGDTGFPGRISRACASVCRVRRR